MQWSKCSQKCPGERLIYTATAVAVAQMNRTPPLDILRPTPWWRPIREFILAAWLLLLEPAVRHTGKWGADAHQLRPREQ